MKNRLEYLDALRGIAAFSVCIHHTLGRLYETLPPAHPFHALIEENAFNQIDLGRFGVVLFFLISGFIIPKSLKPGVPIQKFVVGRLFRLYPAYWVACLLILVTLPYIGIEPISVGQFFANLTMVPAFFRKSYISGIFWTLFIEILFYCCCVALFKIKSLDKPIVIGGGLYC